MFTLCAFIFLTHGIINFAGLHIQILQQKDLNNFLIIDADVAHTGTDACIRKVTDGKSVYILKQINDPSLDEQFLLINDCVASQIGHCAGVPINQVAFIPHDVGTHLKAYPERAATLHTYVSGKDLESEVPCCIHQEFTLQQRVINAGSPWQMQYPLAEDQQGFTRTIIESMCEHETLILLVALDTFIGNSDRSLPNIFYDKQSNGFYGIDQAAAFTRTLPAFAYDRLTELLSEGYFHDGSMNMIDSLCVFRNMLLRLCKAAPPVLIIQSMQQLIIHLPVHTIEQTDIISARMHHHGCIVEKNYCDTLKLIALLGQILDAVCLGKE
jgi:hypothetical protein